MTLTENLTDNSGKRLLSLKNTSVLRENEIAELLVNLVAKFKREAKSYRGSEPIREARYGLTPLLISAPHATPHIRRETTKVHERMTGALAIALAQSLDAAVILPVAAQSDDPNFDTKNNAPYKLKLARMLGDCQLLVDIHGMDDHWGSDICIGIGNSSLTPASTKLIDTLRGCSIRAGLAMTINTPFDSLSRGTVSEFARRRNCEALQLEIALRCRMTDSIASTFFLIRNGLLQWLDSSQLHRL